MRKIYSGAVTWFERCVRPTIHSHNISNLHDASQTHTHAHAPNCWMARSALHGSSKVMWTRLLRFCTRLSACREMPELAASEMMAISWEGRERALVQAFRMALGVCSMSVGQRSSPSLRSWSALSLWCWRGRWTGPAPLWSHIERCCQDAALHVPYGPSSTHTHTDIFIF